MFAIAKISFLLCLVSLEKNDVDVAYLRHRKIFFRVTICTARYVLIQSYPTASKSLKRMPIAGSSGIRDIGCE